MAVSVANLNVKISERKSFEFSATCCKKILRLVACNKTYPKIAMITYSCTKHKASRFGSSKILHKLHMGSKVSDPFYVTSTISVPRLLT